MAGALLKGAGHDVTVFERAPVLKEVGAGIGVLSNGVKALTKLLGEAPFRERASMSAIVISTADGKDLVNLPHEHLTAKLGFPAYIVPRSTLHRLLLNAFGESNIRTNACVESVTNFEHRPALRLANGSSEEFDALIGADGVRSRIRESLHGPGRFRYTRQMCYRAIVPYAAPDSGLNREVYGADVKRFGIHPISDRELYFWAVVPGDQPLPIDAVRERFAGWAFDIPELLERCSPEALLCNPIYDMKPLRRWGKGKVTLLGDAAHPTTPNLGQGGNMALEDSVVLSQRLKSNADIGGAMRQYEKSRIPRTSHLVREARMFGWIGSLQNPVSRWLRDSIYRSLPRFFFYRRMQRQQTFNFA